MPLLQEFLHKKRQKRRKSAIIKNFLPQKPIHAPKESTRTGKHRVILYIISIPFFQRFVNRKIVFKNKFKTKCTLGLLTICRFKYHISKPETSIQNRTETPESQDFLIKINPKTNNQHLGRVFHTPKPLKNPSKPKKSLVKSVFGYVFEKPFSTQPLQACGKLNVSRETFHNRGSKKSSAASAARFAVCGQATKNKNDCFT